ncbi:GGDEF domain-containing protein [Marinomonas sp. 2405UD68-3]|uniref:sensor domain-containing diguanylate cyclase n=1 Tax=Marinomonas sp. 2405UD68-3 TaxID=3391835 RepID=UPI0039C9F6BA
MLLTKKNKFSYRISGQIICGFLLIIMCFMAISFIAFERLSVFQSDAEYHESISVPSFEKLSSLKLHVTRLSSFSRELVNSDALAKLRISYNNIQLLIKRIRIELNLMEDQESANKLLAFISVLEPGLDQLYEKRSTVLQLESQITRQVSSILSHLEKKQLDSGVQSLENFYSWNSISYKISRSMFDLMVKKRKFEINKAKSNLLLNLELLNDLKIESNSSEILFINSAIEGPLGLMSMLEMRSSIQFRLIGISTQNSIISDSILDYVTVLFNDTKEDLSDQALQLVTDANNAQLRLNIIVTISFVIILLIYAGLKYQVFDRIGLLRRLLASGELSSQKLMQFRDQNEIGEVAEQLRRFLLKIEEQQLTITTVSKQLADVIQHSNLRVAVLSNQSIVYHNEYFAEVFCLSEIHSITELSEEFHSIQYDKVAMKEDGESTVLIESYYDQKCHRWFDVIGSSISWQNKKSLLLNLIDVTERQHAAARYERNLSVVEDEVFRDSLTGLFNRKKFDKIAVDLSYNKSPTEFAVLVFDIDLFKDYNDMLGHLEGDDALRKVANVLLSVTPENGLCLRYGGEEFVVVLFDVTAKEAIIVAENALRIMRHNALPHPSKQCEFLSVSIGGALSSESQCDFLTCFDLADKRLFLAKSNGKNQFVFQTGSV